MLKEYTADLHIHSCLSMCADIYMTPMRIVNQAISKGLDMIAICDHNSVENVQYGMNASSKMEGLIFFPGIEITSAEEVHVVGLFGNVEDAMLMQQFVYKNLSSSSHDSTMYEDQIIVNENDEVEGFNSRMLIGSVKINLKSIVDKIHKYNGIAVAAHIDREAFGVVGQLGFIPEDVDFDAVELSAIFFNEKRYKEIDIEQEYFLGRKFPVVLSSDAHNLDEIGRVSTRMIIRSPEFEEVKMALKQIDGRRVAGLQEY